MRIAARLHHPEVGLDATSTHLVVSVTGDDNGSLRPQLGIIPVVDRSGSMGGSNKLTLVTAALGHLAGYLSDEDCAALVSFDDQITVHQAPRSADAAGMASIRSALSELYPRGATDLAGGLAEGLRQAAIMTAANPLMQVRVIVLTDGQTNTGECNPDRIAAMVGDLERRISVSCLGVGTDCDHDLLGRIAEAGRGSYGFIETAAQAPGVLGTEIGGLLEIDAADVTVAITAPGRYATLEAPLGGAGAEEGSGWTVRLGNVMAGATRHVVIPLTTIPPARAHARPVTVCDVVVTGMVDDASIEVVAKPKVHFTLTPKGPDRSLDEVVDLAVVAEAQKQAESLARQGLFGQALDAVRGADVSTTAGGVLIAALAVNYADHGSYAGSASMRNSSSSMLRGSLVGSSEHFDALASRTVGAYTTQAQRDVAMSTTLAAGATGSGPDVWPAPIVEFFDGQGGGPSSQQQSGQAQLSGQLQGLGQVTDFGQGVAQSTGLSQSSVGDVVTPSTSGENIGRSIIGTDGVVLTNTAGVVSNTTGPVVVNTVSGDESDEGATVPEEDATGPEEESTSTEE